MLKILGKWAYYIEKFYLKVPNSVYLNSKVNYYTFYQSEMSSLKAVTPTDSLQS